MIACVCMCGSEVCGGLGDVDWCECECGCVRGWEYGHMYVCVFGDGGGWMCVRCDVSWVVCGVVRVSFNRNRLGPEGGAAMAGAVQHLTSLRTLEYV